MRAAGLRRRLERQTRRTLVHLLLFHQQVSRHGALLARLDSLSSSHRHRQHHGCAGAEPEEEEKDFHPALARKGDQAARSLRGPAMDPGWPDPRLIFHMKAIWNGVVIAESADTVVVEGNHYFPPDAIKPEFFRASATTSVCGWKGLASYYTVSVKGQDNPDAAWYYPTPKPEAAQIAGRVAFWKGVSVHA